MSAENAAVFFYGLFMDESLLRSRGIRPVSAAVGCIEGYTLRIGKRATLLPSAGARAYGVLMTLRTEDVTALYSDTSVADYVAESVSVALPDGTNQTAYCYNLPESKLEGTNAQYADALFALAGRLGLPEKYLRHIRQQMP